MTIQYYIASMLTTLANEREAIQVTKTAMMLLGAIGYAYLKGEISVGEWDQLQNTIAQKADEKLIALDNEKRVIA